MNIRINLQDFNPINNWILENQGSSWVNDDTFMPTYIIDQSTGRKYWNESPNIIRFKCALLAVGSPIVQPLALLVAGVGLNALKILSLSHFWAPDDINSSLTERIRCAFLDLVKIASSPLVLIALEISAFYGIFNPYDGRKLYASIERAYYNGAFLAPCFQPDPTRHAFGGDPKKRNAF